MLTCCLVRDPSFSLFTRPNGARCDHGLQIVFRRFRDASSLLGGSSLAWSAIPQAALIFGGNTVIKLMP
jgi:hypothetical protein